MTKKRKIHIKLKSHSTNEPLPLLENNIMTKLTSSLEIMVKLFTISTTIGIIVGSLTVFSYLSFIQQLNVYANLPVTDTVTIFAVYIIFFLVCSIPFVIPYLLIPSIHDIQYYKPRKPIQQPPFWLFIPAIITFIVYASIVAANEGVYFPCDLIIAIFLAIILILFLYGIKFFKRKYFKKNNNTYSLSIKKYTKFIIYSNWIISIILCLIVFLLFIILLGLIAENLITNKNWRYVFLFFIISLITINTWGVSNYIHSPPKSKEKNMILFSSILFSFTILFFASVLSDNFKINLLYPVRFIEIPKNSSWYLLHNDFQQNSGINKNDLVKLKQKFKCPIPSENAKVEKDITCSSIPEQRNNALYGYMAWNLGDTKIFCPPTVENNKGKKEAAKLATECIVISGKFLQILNENYIDIMPKER